MTFHRDQDLMEYLILSPHRHEVYVDEKLPVNGGGLWSICKDGYRGSFGIVASLLQPATISLPLTQH